jgi:hypothetical protein
MTDDSPIRTAVDPQLPAVSVRSKEDIMKASEPIWAYCLPDSVAVWLDSPMDGRVRSSRSI